MVRHLGRRDVSGLRRVIEIGLLPPPGRRAFFTLLSAADPKLQEQWGPWHDAPQPEPGMPTLQSGGLTDGG